MAILRSIDGTFYEIDDSELDKYKVPPEKVKSVLEECAKMPQGPRPPQGGYPMGQPPGQSPQIIVQFITQGPPMMQGPPPPMPQPTEEAEGEKVEPQQLIIGFGGGWDNWHNWMNYYRPWHDWHNYHHRPHW